MATYALAPKRWNPHPWLWLPAVLMMTIAGWMLIENMHSYFGHRELSEQAYNCFRQHGPFAVWRARNDKKEMAYHFLCMDQMGDFFDVIMREDGQPLSAYKLNRATTMPQAIEYVMRKVGSSHFPWERIPQALMEAIRPYLPSGFAGL